MSSQLYDSLINSRTQTIIKLSIKKQEKYWKIIAFTYNFLQIEITFYKILNIESV
jgi:hypothetical protein